MKTIFDTLNSPLFRERPAVYIGKKDLYTLHTWIDGYVSACEDAGTQNLLNTVNNVPISLLPDYISWKEQNNNAFGIPGILTEAADGQIDVAWERFLSHLDDFETLKIRSVWHMNVTAEMSEYAVRQERILQKVENGKLKPVSFQGYVFRKAVLNQGLCWITTEYPEDVNWNPLLRSLMPEEEADKGMAELFGDFKWEPAEP